MTLFLACIASFCLGWLLCAAFGTEFTVYALCLHVDGRPQLVQWSAINGTTAWRAADQLIAERGQGRAA